MTSPKRPAGFTLLEMVVVLAILAILTGMAVASFTAVEDQTRFDASTRQLDEIEFAVLGERNLRNPNNQPLINGFVADMGRLPVALDLDGVPSTPPQPSELWSPVVSNSPLVTLDSYVLRSAIAANISSAYIITPTTPLIPPALQSLVALTPITDVADSTVFVGTGWRGPYLRLGVGKETLTDSWGNAFDSLRIDNSAAVPGDVAFGMLSRGSDYPNIGAAVGFERDQFFNAANPNDRFRGAVTVNLKKVVAGLVTVQLFTPDGAGKLVCFQMTATTVSSNQIVQFYFPTQANLGTATTVSTIGTRVVKAYVGAKTAALTTGSALTFTVSPGDNIVSLELP